MMSKDLEDGKKTCINTVYDECMYGALVGHMKRQTQDEGGCTVPWVMENGAGAQDICKLEKNINITFWEAWNRVTNQKDDCPVPCNTLLVNVGAKNLAVSATLLLPSHVFVKHLPGIGLDRKADQPFPVSIIGPCLTE